MDYTLATQPEGTDLGETKFNEVILNAVLIDKYHGAGFRRGTQDVNHYIYNPIWRRIIPSKDFEIEKIAEKKGPKGYWLVFSNLDGFQTDRIEVFIPDLTRKNKKFNRIIKADPKYLTIGQQVLMVFKGTNPISKPTAIGKNTEVKIKHLIPVRKIDWSTQGRFAVVLEEKQQQKRYLWSSIDPRLVNLLAINEKLWVRVSQKLTKLNENKALLVPQKRMLLFVDLFGCKNTDLRKTDIRFVNRFKTKRSAEMEIELITKGKTKLLGHNEEIELVEGNEVDFFLGKTYQQAKVNGNVVSKTYRLAVIDLNDLSLSSNQYKQQIDDVYMIPALDLPYYRLVYVENQWGSRYGLINLDNTSMSFEGVTDQYGLEGLIDLVRSSRPSMVGHIKQLLRSNETLEKRS